MLLREANLAIPSSSSSMRHHLDELEELLSEGSPLNEAKFGRISQPQNYHPKTI